MEGISGVIARVSKVLNAIAGGALTLMMLMTVGDVLMRAIGRPIIGTYEIVSMLLGVVIGFGIPTVLIDKGHVYMEFLIERLSKRNAALMHAFTRLLCIVLFVLIGYNLFSAGNEFRVSGEVSPTLQLPFYPIAYGVGICCFVSCLVFVMDIVKVFGGKYE